MNKNEYNAVCDKILSATMQYVDTPQMKTYSIDKSTIDSEYGAIYKSAIASKAPITLVFTPAGTGKSAIIKDRISCLKNIGVDPSKIMVLNMNIAKVKQMKQDMPDVNIMTFSDFVHNMVIANYPELQLSDMTSIANTLHLYHHDNITNMFINKLNISNPQDKITLLTLFVNTYLNDVIERLRFIDKTEYSLDAMICQNMMYQFEKNPYDVETIIINGIQNMPMTTVCSVIEYANRYQCNLFITGLEGETIYEFNMAYGNIMNALSSYTDRNIDMIRLNNTPFMDKSIKDIITLNANTRSDFENIDMKCLKANMDISVPDMLRATMGIHTDYLKSKLDNNEQVLIMAISKNDVADIKQILVEDYKSIYPNLNIIDLTTKTMRHTSYGTLASKHYDSLSVAYPDKITVGTFFYELYNILAEEAKNADTPYMHNQYAQDKKDIQAFMNEHMDKFISPSQEYRLIEIITKIIDIESDVIQEYVKAINDTATLDFTNANIILATIHTAIDIRCDNIIAFLKNVSEKPNEIVYKTAISRANKSASIIFANYKGSESIYERYLKVQKTGGTK